MGGLVPRSRRRARFSPADLGDSGATPALDVPPRGRREPFYGAGLDGDGLPTLLRALKLPFQMMYLVCLAWWST